MVVERLAEQEGRSERAIAKILLLTGLGQPFCRSRLFHTGHIGAVGCPVHWVLLSSFWASTMSVFTIQVR